MTMALTKTNLLLLIFFFIGCQQFPILRIGGPIRIYEIIGLLMLLLFGVKKPTDLLTWGFFILFVLSPIISFINSFFVDIPPSFFTRYPAAHSSFKFSGRTYSVFQLLFSIVCYVVVREIIVSKNIWVNFSKWSKRLVVIGFYISIIGILNAFVYNAISKLPEFIQNIGEYKFRNNGLFLEPSMYVLYQTWIVLLSFVHRKNFANSRGTIYLIVNVFSLMVTFSSTLSAFALGLLTIPFVYKTNKRNRIAVILGLCLLIIGIYAYMMIYNQWDYFYYTFYDKIDNFFTPSDHTMDSGSYRNFTSRVGLEIFKDHPLLGVGVGNSPFFMHLYENKMGIVVWGETLAMGIMPQSFYSCLLAEQGILGGIGFLIILITLIPKVWKGRNSGSLGRVFYLGCLVNLGVLFSVPIIYSMYLWVFLALALSYYKLEK